MTCDVITLGILLTYTLNQSAVADVASEAIDCSRPFCQKTRAAEEDLQNQRVIHVFRICPEALLREN